MDGDGEGVRKGWTVMGRGWGGDGEGRGGDGW